MEVFIIIIIFSLPWEDEYKGTDEILGENEGWSGWTEKREEIEHQLWIFIFRGLEKKKRFSFAFFH